MPSLPRIRPRRLAAPAVPPDDKRPRVTEVQGEGFGFGSETTFWTILGSFVLLIVSTLGFFRHKRWL